MVPMRGVAPRGIAHGAAAGGRQRVTAASAEERSIVEVDGGYHARREAADTRRDAKLRRVGYRVLRVRAREVLHELPEVLERIPARASGLRALSLAQRGLSPRTAHPRWTGWRPLTGRVHLDDRVPTYVIEGKEQPATRRR